MALDIREPEIQKDEILPLEDSDFNTANVCIVTGSGSGAIGKVSSIHAHACTANKPVRSITTFGLRALTQSISAEGAGKIRSFAVSAGFIKTPLALNRIPAQAAQRAVSQEQVAADVMMGKSRVREMMSPVEVAKLFIFGFSRYTKLTEGGTPPFDSGMVLTT